MMKSNTLILLGEVVLVRMHPAWDCAYLTLLRRTEHCAECRVLAKGVSGRHRASVLLWNDQRQAL
jgi:hypothetical protein